jgi:hypothetical protein
LQSSLLVDVLFFRIAFLGYFSELLFLHSYKKITFDDDGLPANYQFEPSSSHPTTHNGSTLRADRWAAAHPQSAHPPCPIDHVSAPQDEKKGKRVPSSPGPRRSPPAAAATTPVPRRHLHSRHPVPLFPPVAVPSRHPLPHLGQRPHPRARRISRAAASHPHR